MEAHRKAMGCATCIGIGGGSQAWWHGKGNTHNGDEVCEGGHVAPSPPCFISRDRETMWKSCWGAHPNGGLLGHQAWQLDAGDACTETGAPGYMGAISPWYMGVCGHALSW